MKYEIILIENLRTIQEKEARQLEEKISKLNPELDERLSASHLRRGSELPVEMTLTALI